MEYDEDDSDVSSDGDGANVDLDYDALEQLPNGRKDIKHAATKMIVDMRSTSAMTRTGVRKAISGAELVLKVNNRSLRQDVNTYLTEIGVVNNPEAQVLLSQFENTTPFDGTRSNKGQVSTIQKYYSFIKPEQHFIDDRLDQRLQDGANYQQVPVHNSYSYVSVKKILSLIASKPAVMDYLRNLRPSEDGMLRGFIDSDQYRNSPFFQQHPDAFQCVLYEDGVDPARGLGPKSGLHEIGNFLLIILNVPPVLNSLLSCIHPLVCANALDCKETFVGVLGRFVEEMRELEEGVRVFVNGEFIEIFATLVAVKADSKAAHEVLGFLGCGARHFCRQCMISRQQLHSGEVILGEPRTPELTEEQLRRVALNFAYSTECGLHYRSCLTDIRHFHPANNHCFDLMHDGPEGVIIMLIRLCMQQFIIVEGLFQVEELNERIGAYQYGRQNMNDKPTPNFSLESLRQAPTVHKQKQNAAQILVLFRALPFILDSIGNQGGVPEESEHLQMLLLLSRIWRIGCAPCMPRDIINYLRRLLETLHRSWYVVFPHVHPINRFHHLQHLAENILSMGPQRPFWCFREEGKNCPLRRHIATCNNFINPYHTTMEQAQILQAKVWGTNSEDVVIDGVTLIRRQTVLVATLPVFQHLQALGFNANDEIRTVVAAVVNGFEYRIGEFVLYRRPSESFDNLPRFGRIVCVICPENSDLVWCGVEAWSTDMLVERFEAYQVSPTNGAPIHLLDVRDLPLHPPIMQEVDGELFTDFNEAELKANFSEIPDDQINEIMKIVLQLKHDRLDKAKDKLEKGSVNGLGCGTCFVERDGNLRKVKDLPLTEKEIIWDTKPCISRSFFEKKISKYSYNGLAATRPRIDPQTVEPMDVLLVLNTTAFGQEIIDSVLKNKCLSYAHEAQMMNALCDHFDTSEKSLNKNATLATSISIAKGIVEAFPDLADKADCIWQSWYHLALRKLSTISPKPGSNQANTLSWTETDVDSDLIQTECSVSSWATAGPVALSSASTSSVEIPTNPKRKWNADRGILLETTTSSPALRLRLVRSKDDKNSWKACPPKHL